MCWQPHGQVQCLWWTRGRGELQMVSWRCRGRFQCKGLEVSIYSWNSVAASIMWCLRCCLPMTHSRSTAFWGRSVTDADHNGRSAVYCWESLCSLSPHLLSFSHTVCVETYVYGNISRWRDRGKYYSRIIVLTSVVACKHSMMEPTTSILGKSSGCTSCKNNLMGFFLCARLVSKTILQIHSKAMLFAKFQTRTKKILQRPVHASTHIPPKSLGIKIMLLYQCMELIFKHIKIASDGNKIMVFASRVFSVHKRSSFPLQHGRAEIQLLPKPGRL